jgi:hypothetical protein
MIDNLRISYDSGSINKTLTTDLSDSNYPYNLAEIFSEVIKDSNANEDIIIESLINEFGYNKDECND